MSAGYGLNANNRTGAYQGKSQSYPVSNSGYMPPQLGEPAPILVIVNDKNEQISSKLKRLEEIDLSLKNDFRWFSFFLCFSLLANISLIIAVITSSDGNYNTDLVLVQLAICITGVVASFAGLYNLKLKSVDNNQQFKSLLIINFFLTACYLVWGIEVRFDYAGITEFTNLIPMAIALFLYLMADKFGKLLQEKSDLKMSAMRTSSLSQF